MSDCEHSKVTPEFDEKAAQQLSSTEVRKNWPRFSGVCPDCNARMIAYASFAHFIAGDW